MSDWTRGDTTEGNGYMWENESAGMSAFEDTSEGYSQWYAWRGDSYAHDTAEQTAVFPTRDEAVAALPEMPNQPSSPIEADLDDDLRMSCPICGADETHLTHDGAPIRTEICRRCGATWYEGVRLAYQTLLTVKTGLGRRFAQADLDAAIERAAQRGQPLPEPVASTGPSYFTIGNQIVEVE